MCDRAIWLDHGQILAEGNPDAVVQRYRGDDARVESSRLSHAPGISGDHRWGTGRIEILRVRLLNDRGIEKTLFQTGDRLVLKIDYRCHEAVSAPFFGMAIHRQDGLHITGPNTTFAGLDLPVLEGGGTVTYTIPYLPLLDGLYHISVAVVNHDDTEIFDYHDRAYPFRVANYDGRIRERYGLMTLQGEWAHAATPASEPRVG